ncbi:MAG TPA: Gfo/Idh/MocA family oxidoreductase [Gemmataceae bacterium]|nr:Gfo/Idh/MocA family oxidoreductase [Gemmataceae bacterium]
MALDMTPEQREIGKANFDRAVNEMANPPHRPGMSRRSFMKGMLAAGAAVPLTAAAYFGYTRLHGRPVRAALIGAGDEGGILVGESNPDFIEFVACCDIRPSNKKRIYDGEPPAAGPGGLWRKGFKRLYGNNAERSVRWYDNYKDLLENPDIEMVVIALPLHLHAPVSMDCMRAGKHVLCEKLMARTVSQCKEMVKVSKQTDKLLAIGHQRHYSLLYAQAVELINSGVLGEVRHIRALWHRNQLPGRDSWRKTPPQEDVDAINALGAAKLKELGYDSPRELFNWRTYRRTGGGLMAELGSHQLDACSIFLGKVHPVAVSGTGLKCYYDDDREIEDHVLCTFEFPGKGYSDKPPRDKGTGLPNFNKTVAVTYSSVTTNAFENYGECVMGTQGTLVVQQESEAMLYPPSAAGRSTSVTVTTSAAGAPALDSWGSGPAPGAASSAAPRPAGATTYSRGYREEMEHMAYCIRMRNQGMERDREDLKPRCHGLVAMGDAIIALGANEAFHSQKREEFKESWFTESEDQQALPTWETLSKIS